MAGDERVREHPPTDQLEERLQRWLQVLTGLVFLGLIVALALADTFGRDSNLRASEFIFASLVGGLLLVGGVKGAGKFIGRK